MIKALIAFLIGDRVDPELLRFVKSEYKGDWEYAYQALINGRKPQEYTND